MSRALIAMSGGVDSSVAAYMMKQKGYDCIGITMKLFHNEDAGISRERTCCSLDDVEDARSVAARLGIPFYVLNFTDDFRSQVMDRFIRAYEEGYTPNPCIDCNRYIKFRRLHDRAKELECDVVVTGHYARVEKVGDRYVLKKGKDPSKDQSYVLYSMTQEQLAYTRFPLGEYTKSEIREIADQQGFINAKKKDSQDICFVPDGDYAKVIASHTGKTYPHGNFIDKSGKVLGEHQGIIRYTIGQRKGLGIALNEPMYVCEKDVEHNTVTLCRNDELFRCELDVKDFNWISGEVPTEPIRANVSVRYHAPEQPALVVPTSDSTVHITFDRPQRAFAKGQAAVVYDGDIVVGGGTIC